VFENRVTDADFQRAFNEHKDAVYRFAWRMSSSPAAAEDITQDVFVELLRHGGRFDPSRGSLRSFLLGVARNLALKRWRSEHRLEALEEEEFVAEPLNIEQGEIGELVGRAVRALPPLQREVIVLAEYEELSLEEIARAIETKVGTVKSRLHRGRENLRKMLEPLRTPAHGRP
jgi:RNA polymerase sigma-70 factor (ECF subfamily)